ncbi:pectate lyase [Flavobacterium alvei]|mgnify:FL=1|uniref:pectate lyase n=1 Tax=Flavobacterium alvei TaxID=2080416 RepID=UPI0026EDBBD1|nr:pectate lyase [Flavobacterium alvei]
MKTTNRLLLILMCFVSTMLFAQEESSDYLKHNWKYVATKMPGQWYGSNEAELLSQRNSGVWEKNKQYQKPFTVEEREHYIKEKNEIGGTFDNGSTILELRFLAKVYSHAKDKRYKEAFEKGLNYIFTAQYENGGWPQYFPPRKGNVSYSGHITYNDNAMVNAMRFLKEIASSNKEYAPLELNKDFEVKAQQSFNKGIECILKTQIVVKGVPTVWCAQHDEITLAPANARAYELKSYSGSESVEIMMLLMNVKNPSKEIIAAVNGAEKWFETHQIDGIKLETVTQADGQPNKVVVEDKNAPRIWARFYDLDTEKPYFCDRDGIKRKTFAEMGYNRRNGYDWYTYSPENALNKYAQWKSENHIN